MLNKFNTLLGRVSDVLNKAVEKICIGMIGVLVAVILIGVFYRYVLRRGLPWPEEMARAINIWVAYLGASIGVKYGDHVGVDLLVGLLPGKIRAVFRFLTRILVVFFLSIIAYYCFLYTASARSTTPALLIPVRYINVALFTGISLMILHLLSSIVNDIHTAVTSTFSSLTPQEGHPADEYPL